MDYNIKKDLLFAKDILDLTDEKFSEFLGVSRMTLYRWINEEVKPNDKMLEQIYNNLYKQNIHLNDVKQELYKTKENKNHLILFHGAKNKIIGQPSIEYSENNKDFSKGFYLGVDIRQSASFVFSYKKSSVYVFDFNLSKVKIVEFDVSKNWMLLVAYYRGRLDEYKDSKLLKNLLKKTQGADVIIAPIADNTMYSILNDFIEGEITDEQCYNALSANRLGKQYIFLNDKIINSNLKMIDRLYLCNDEKEYYKKINNMQKEVGKNKAKMAKRQYAGKGKYIEELFE